MNRWPKREKHLPQQTYANERSRMRSSTTIKGSRGGTIPGWMRVTY